MTPVGVFFICQNEDKCHFVNSTNLCRIGFHAQDLMAALFCVACFALFLLQPQIAFWGGVRG